MDLPPRRGRPSTGFGEGSVRYSAQLVVLPPLLYALDVLLCEPPCFGGESTRYADLLLRGSIGVFHHRIDQLSAVDLFDPVRHASRYADKVALAERVFCPAGDSGPMHLTRAHFLAVDLGSSDNEH